MGETPSAHVESVLDIENNGQVHLKTYLLVVVSVAFDVHIPTWEANIVLIRLST